MAQLSELVQLGRLYLYSGSHSQNVKIYMAFNVGSKYGESSGLIFCKVDRKVDRQVCQVEILPSGQGCQFCVSTVLSEAYVL